MAATRRTRPPTEPGRPLGRPAVASIGRLTEIAQVAARHGFGYLFETRRPWQRRRDPDGDGAEVPSARGQHLRELLDELGPTFVKFGQLLSTRPDIVPPDIVAELRLLQDQVTPFPFADVERVIEEELGLTIERAFAAFDETSIAAASIGQVHVAELPNGERVAVKVQRPSAPRQIEADLDLLYQAARIVRERVRALRFIDTVGLVDEFARSIRQELDYTREAANAERFARNFAAEPAVAIPQVYRRYSAVRVLTTELLEGTELARLDYATLSEDERRTLAYRIAEAWLEMIFRHGFFHADPHPANVLVLAEGRIGLVDFGQAGKLSQADLEKLTALFVDAVHENIEVLPKRLAELGVRFPREREAEFVGELYEVYDKYYGVRLGEIDALQLVREGFALIHRMNLRLPTRFVLLDKAIATVGSVGQELYPDFNVFEVARPYARDLVRARFSPVRLASRLRDEARHYGLVASAAPFQVHDVLEELRDGEVEIGFRHKGLDDLAHRLDLVFNRLVVAVVATGGVIGSSLIAVFADAGPRVLGINVVALVGLILASLLGMWLVWGVIRSGRL